MNQRSLLAGLLTAGISLSAAAQEVEHFTRIEDAVKASKGRKDIIVDFTGSDWCGWCIKLVKEVFSTEEWTKAAAGKYVFVEIDFPQKKKLSDEETKYNGALQRKFGVEGYPTIFVLDPEGRPYAKTGYQPGGPEAYLKHLAGFEERKKEIAELRAKAADAKEQTARIAALSALLMKLDLWELAGTASDLKEEIVDAGGPDAARRLKYASELALDAKRQGQAERYEKYLAIVRKIDELAAQDVEMTLKFESDILPLFQKKAWDKALEILKPLATTYPKGRAGQQVLLYTGVCHFRSDRNTNTLSCHLTKKASYFLYGAFF